MADIDFPEYLAGAKTLSLPLRAGYGYTPGELTAQTTFDLGTLQVQIYTDAPPTFSVTWFFTSAQVAYFAGWWRWKLKAGVLPFNIRLQADGTLEPREVRIIGRPNVPDVPSPDGYRVTAVLEAARDTVMSEAMWEIVESGGLGALYELYLAAALAVNSEI